ncbi:hypothetical protein B0O80DRAFT_430695 [Mortierella sp. GBAus27b]|nr:hypothetical protein B0O80DRAFT_430695 [Mortierella sp. GBAus27b]
MDMILVTEESHGLGNFKSHLLRSAIFFQCKQQFAPSPSFLHLSPALSPSASVTNSIVPSPKGALLPHQVLDLTTIFLENANKTTDHDILLVLCHHAEAALSRMKALTKKTSTSADPKDQALRV